MAFLWSSTHPSQPLLLGVAAAVVVFGTAVLSGGMLYLRAQDALLEEVRSDLRRTAVVAAAAIDVNLHRKLTRPEQEGSAEYESAVAPLRTILRSSTSIRFLYTCILKDGMVFFVLDPLPKGDADNDGVEDHSALMDPYEEANEVMRGVLAGGPAATDAEPVTDRWGTTISGYAPFHDELGNTMGAVGVDIDLEIFQQRMSGMFSALGLGAVLAFVCSALVGLVVTRSAGSLQRARILTDSQAKVLKAERQEAERANKAKDEFLAMMTHEIRTPLNAVIGLADLMLTGEIDVQQRRHLSIIRFSGEHLLSMINDILDHSKIDAGHMTLEELSFSPRDCAGEVVTLMQDSADAKGLRLALTIDGPVSERVIGDPIRLRQVLINLVANGIKFTPTGSVTVGLRAEQPGGTITFSVVDTGVGMDESARARIFRPFTQGDSSISRRFGGTGLGLSISQRLVTLMGGSISVESAPGRGSAFAFALPLKATTRATSNLTCITPTTQVPQLRGCVLVVDDHQVNRQVAAAMLRRIGVAVEESTDGASALQRIGRGGLDVVLMDCQMPDQDGIAVTAELRLREGNGRRLPVIGLSAATSPQDRERCRQAGMDSFLPKPVRLDQLANELAKFLPKVGESTVGNAPATSSLPASEPAQPTQESMLPLMDLQVLGTLRSLDPDLSIFNHMVDTYLSEATATIASIVFDAVSGQREGLGQRAHGMRGAALTIGLTRLAKALNTFENLIDSSDDQLLAEAATALEQIFAESSQALRSQRERTTPVQPT